MTAASGRAQHIVLIGPISPHRGGVAQHTAQLASALADGGHHVVVESWRKQYPSLLYRRRERDPAAHPHPGARFDLRWFDPISWVRVARRNRHADSLVIQWVTPFNFAAVVVMRALMSPHRSVAIVHNARPHEWFPLVGPLSRLALRKLDQIVCHARSILEDLRDLGIRAADDIVVQHPPNVAIEVTDLPERPPTKLLFLGYLRHYKGADIAVASLAQLTQTRPDLDLHLTVAGEAWSPEDRIDSLARESGVEDRVTIIESYLTDDHMAALIGDHHLLVAPYRSATQSGVISLALAGGRAVVATNVGGLAEVVIDGVNGICCAPEDVAAFSAATVQAVDRLEELTSGAARRAASWDEVAHHLLRPSET